MVEVRFEELPGQSEVGRRPIGAHKEIAEQLRSRPGEWANIGKQATAKSAGSLAYNIRNGRISAYVPVGHYEASARTVGGEHRLYVRYVGENTDA